MEQAMRDVQSALDRLSGALDALESVRQPYNALKSYYGSAQWKRDYADDEAGKLPKELPRGVLSEDGVYDLLSNLDVLITHMHGFEL